MDSGPACDPGRGPVRMESMKIITLFFCLGFLTPCAFAQGQKEIKDIVGGMDVNKSEVSDMIDKLVSEGKINGSDAEKAKDDLQKMNREDFQKLKDKGKSEVINGKLLEETPSESKHIDIPEPTFEDPSSN